MYVFRIEIEIGRKHAVPPLPPLYETVCAVWLEEGAEIAVRAYLARPYCLFFVYCARFCFARLSLFLSLFDAPVLQRSVTYPTRKKEKG